jgi:hypothetical protein
MCQVGFYRLGIARKSTYFRVSKLQDMLLIKRLIGIVLLLTNHMFAQLSGNAQLANQSNHSGIKVKFIANSGTAVTDSTLTDAAGNYSINISGGIYYVALSKQGYQTSYYSNNSAVVLTNTVVMSQVILNPGNIVNVSGSVFGTWLSSNIYIVQSDLTVDAGNSLFIQPGTHVRFNGNYIFNVNGTLTAEGAGNDTIYFTSNNVTPNAGDWKGFNIQNSATKIRYSKIEFANRPIQIISSSPLIAQNDITKFYEMAMYIENSSGWIYGNTIHDFYATFQTMGIISNHTLPTAQPLRIECNSIHSGVSTGIRIQGYCLVKNNVIANLTHPITGSGILCSYDDSSIVQNNHIYNCQEGVQLYGWATTHTRSKVLNNTIYNSVKGINIQNDVQSGHVITNNILINNQHGIYADLDQYSAPLNINHNLVWNNSSANYFGTGILGIGQSVNTNSNGDPIDSYYNLSQDPMFINSTPPLYGSGSPCINAGNNAYSSNIGYSAGAYCNMVITGLAQNAKVFEEAKVYPNPFSNEFTILAKDSFQKIEIHMFDLLSNEVKLNTIDRSEATIRVTTDDIAQGIYFLEVRSENSSRTIKLIKN